jgi:hypothetical protein
MPSALSAHLGSDLLTEWDARDLSLSNDDPIVTWTKSAASTEGNDLANSNSARRPLFKTGTYPYAQFDGSDDVLFCDLVTDPHVIFMVVEATSDSAQRAFCSPVGTGGAYLFCLVQNGSSLVFTNGMTPDRVLSIAAWPNATRLAVAVFAKSDSTGMMRQNTAHALPITTRANLGAHISIGGFNKGTAYPWSGRVYYAATAKTMSVEKIARGLATLNDEWDCTGELPETVSGGGGTTFPLIGPGGLVY